MTTYEHGKQPDGAPVTWYIDYMGQWVVITHHEFIVEGSPHTETLGHSRRALGIMGCEKFAERRCRAFHLAKLAEDYAKAVDSLCHQALSDAGEAIIKAVKS